jgi:nucleotide-binding universal stress UspA family protein
MDIFDRIVCGIDGTPESDVALSRALQLSSPETRLILAHAFLLTPVDENGLIFGDQWIPEEAQARKMLKQAKTWALTTGTIDAARVETRVVRGPKAWGLLGAAEEASATLLCVGSHGHSRLGGAIRGSVASNALHSARCSVLIARDSRGDATEAFASFPRLVVCGVDGSAASAGAAAAAHALSERKACDARYLAAEDGLGVSFAEASKAAPTPGALRIEAGRPVDVLLAQSRTADLLVIGSRGLGGSRAIGSVSERVAHEAECSVLAVRA